MSTITEWTFLHSTEASWDHIAASCEQAETSIDIVHFIFGADGEIVDRMAEIFRRKAKQGVRVRLLFDVVGSFPFFASKLRFDLARDGVEIIFHSTTIPPSLKRLFPFFLRDHRKLIVIDEEEAHIGGVIIQERARDWRDTNVVIRGPIVRECTELFTDAWEKAKHMRPMGPMVTHDGKGEFFLSGNSFRLRDKDLYRSIVKAVAGAKKNIYMATPYFALTRDLRRAFAFARSNGADIRVLLPKRSDNLYADVIARFFYGWMLRKGIRIFHYTESILHAKTVTIDGSWATVGSCNIDWLSMWLNYELNLVANNRQFADELGSQFHVDLKGCEEVTLRTPGWYGFFGGKKEIVKTSGL